jgi:hypothetical protein
MQGTVKRQEIVKEQSKTARNIQNTRNSQGTVKAQEIVKEE